MNIACLAWGSLLWDARELPLQSDWAHDGPMLPVEFARQSNDGRITLVLTPGAMSIKVFTARLDAPSMEDARTVLAKREGISSRFVAGSVGHWTPDSESDHPETKAVGTWASEAGWGGVVWTALKPKFDGAYVTPSCLQVVTYLDSLTGETRKQAETYVRRTPTPVRTVYRMAIEEALGWTAV